MALLLITVSKSRRDRNRNSGLVIALTSVALVIKRIYKRRFTSYDNRVNHLIINVEMRRRLSWAQNGDTRSLDRRHRPSPHIAVTISCLHAPPHLTPTQLSYCSYSYGSTNASDFIQTSSLSGQSSTYANFCEFCNAMGKMLHFQ